MRHEKLVLSVVASAAFSALFLASCGGGGAGAGTPDGGGGGGGGALTCMNAKITAAESLNYGFSSTLTFPPVKVKPNTEWTFDWSAVTKDFMGHTVNPGTDLNLIMMMLWNMPVPDLQTKLNADTLAMSDLAVLPLSIKTDGKAMSSGLYAFTLNGNPITPAELAPYLDPTMYAPENHVYTVMAATGTTLGQGIRMIQSFQLDPASTNTMVKLSNDSTKLTYMANLHSLKTTGVTAGTAAITLDWGKMTTNALGNPFITTNITDALVGHYTETPAELEAQFLDLELIAKDLYRTTIPAGTVLDFSTLKNKDGQSFTGIDNTGTWIVALKCGACRNPAPWYLAILKPC
jgi:hypothetical protein